MEVKAYWTLEFRESPEDDYPQFLFQKYPDSATVNVYDSESMREIDVFTMNYEEAHDWNKFVEACKDYVKYQKEQEEDA